MFKKKTDNKQYTIEIDKMRANPPRVLIVFSKEKKKKRKRRRKRKGRRNERNEWLIVACIYILTRYTSSLITLDTW